MKKRILSFVLALAMVLGVMPFSAFAAPGDYSSGKDDTASYVLDVSAADEYSTIIKYSEGHDFEIVESNGESFLSCKPRVNWTNHSYDPWARIYTYENTYGGFTDPESVNLSAINYFAWRIKIPAGETPIAFSLFMEHDLYSELLDTGACTFIDNKTREVSTAITPGYGRGKAVLVNAGEGFDGWMILDLNQDFINGYTHGDIPQKDFFLGIVDEGVERTAANSFTGVFHLCFHRNACTHVELDGSFETDFANREVLFGDAFIVEDIDAFKAVRLSCEEAGHVLEPTDDVTPPDCDDQGYTIMQCIFCEHTEQGNFVDPTGHTWVEDHREEASCTEPEKIYVSCACGATDVQEGEAARGHEMDTLDYKEPTCEESGYLEEECIYCGEYSWKDLDSAHKYEDGACVWCGKADPNALPKHETEDEHEWEIVSEEPATCQVPNKIHYTCICGATKTEDGETVDHDMQPKGIGTPATCVAAGSHEEFCSYECGKIETVIDEINPDAHSFKAGTCTLCGAPNLVSYVTGKGDTARYALDVSAADEYSTVIKYSEGYDFEIVESNGESFLKAKPRDSWLNYDYDPWARLYTYENTFGGFTDDKAVDLDAINYFAWRIKVPAGEKSFSFSIYMEHNLYSEILDLSKATFIDYATRDVSTSVTAGYGGSRAMLVNANEGFDGWMILDLNQDFINSYTHGDIPHKDFFLGIVDEGVERTASNSFTGVFHIETHRNACTHVGGASYESSYADREILFGDALFVENIDTFKAVRFSCDEAGHVYEDGVCKFCGEESPIPEHGENDHDWKEIGRDAGTCAVPEKIHFDCICGATKTEDGELNPNAHNFKGGACVDCGEPNDVSYATGKGDTATYALDVSTISEYTSVMKYSEGYDFELIEEDGETFIKAMPRASWLSYVYDPWARVYTYENTFGGFTDDKAVDLDAINYFAWRIKVPAGETQLAFSMYMEHNLYSELIDLRKAVFIDNATREVSTSVTAGYGEKRAMLINANEGFDGWMILDLNQDFIENYTHSDIPQKDFFLGIVDEGEEKVATNAFTGVIHLEAHRNACEHLGETYAPNFDRPILLGDALLVEDLDTFKEVRFSCDEAGHVYEDGACKFCGEIEEIPVPPVENPTLIVNSATANSITVSWNAVDGVNSYFVQVADKATGAVVKTVHAVDATTATIYGLTGGTEYTVAICSHIPGRPVAYAAPVDAATVGYASLGLTATKDGNFAILNWTKPANAVEYYVYILDGDEIVKVARVANADQTTFTFVLPLDAGTYSFGIIAVTEGNVYEPMQKSADQIVVSEFANPTPVIGAATAKTINVSWNAVDGVSEYYVRVIDKATGAVVKTVRVVGATETTVYGLTANTEYEISICAYSVGRPATYSDAVDAATIDYAALALNVTVNGKEATFSWTKPADAVAYYLYVLRGDETVKVAGVQDPDATSFVLWVPDAEGCTFGIIAATDSGAGVVYSPMQYAAN